MPLFAHWRAPACVELAWPQGGDPPAAAIFCPYDAPMERRLRLLHDRQRTHGDVQHEIDTYLVACIAPPLARLRLPRHSVPHYRSEERRVGKEC